MRDKPTSIQELAERCREETRRARTKRAGQTGSCFELFHRAIVEGSQEAWEAVYAQYRGLVLHWLGANPGDREDLIQCAFVKFLGAIDADIFSRFPSIASILAYLRRCAKSVKIDTIRKAEREQMALQAIQDRYPLETSPTELEMLGRIMRRECADHIYGRLQDEEERLVVYLSFELGLKPSQIAQRYPALFSSAHQVSGVKEKVLRRMSQDPVLLKMYQSVNDHHQRWWLELLHLEGAMVLT